MTTSGNSYEEDVLDKENGEEDKDEEQFLSEGNHMVPTAAAASTGTTIAFRRRRPVQHRITSNNNNNNNNMINDNINDTNRSKSKSNVKGLVCCPTYYHSCRSTLLATTTNTRLTFMALSGLLLVAVVLWPSSLWFRKQRHKNSNNMNNNIPLPLHVPRDWSWWQWPSQQRQELGTAIPSWMIFYNIYVPNETQGQAHALAIVAEQLQQIKNSYAVHGSSSSNKTETTTEFVVHLFYNTIGTDHILKQTWMEQQVNTRRNNNGYKVQVHFGQHYNQANEDVTLQDLYDFCQVHPQARAIYLHSKGSFHYYDPNMTNSSTGGDVKKPESFATQDKWRQLLTAAATSRHCLETTPSTTTTTTTTTTTSPTPNLTTCDTCSLLFQPLPSCHYPGNMWVASCAHVRQLLPPMGFDVDMDRRVVQTMKRIRNDAGTLQTQFFPQMPHMMGRKRFASEHWLGSHPSLLHPCHVTSTANLSEWLHTFSSGQDDAVSLFQSNNNRKDKKNKMKELEQQHFQNENALPHMVPAYPAPGFDISHKHWDFYRYGSRGTTVLQNETLRRRDYFLLPGQILKWYLLYGSVPPMTSWVYQWFPDGLYWQQKIMPHVTTPQREQAKDTVVQPLVVKDSIMTIWNPNNDHDSSNS
ncbi:hypothetical protein ACA910_016047 [Epithemia clementina (nom. ined.)]